MIFSKQARKRQPILRRFRHNWVTSEILKTYTQNKRKLERRKAAMRTGGRRNQTTSLDSSQSVRSSDDRSPDDHNSRDDDDHNSQDDDAYEASVEI